MDLKSQVQSSPVVSDRSSPSIAARLTAEIPAAIATIAVRGASAGEIVARRVELSCKTLEVGRVYYGVWQLSLGMQEDAFAGTRQGTPATAEQVVVCRMDNDRFEIHCHGGAAVCQAILADLARAGCAMVSQVDWPSALKCAIARAAEHDLLLTSTDRTAAILLDQLQGALRAAVEALIEALKRGEPRKAARRIEELLRWTDLGLHLAHPWRIVLAGPPNVGKSSLMNALIGTQQAIVHHEPGTTRDWIESTGAIDGWPVLLTDTAGVRESHEPIEQAGVHRSKERLQQCDLAILVVDAQQGWTDVHEQLLQLAPAQPLVVMNKMDLARKSLISPTTSVSGLPKGLTIVPTCAMDRSSIVDLLAAISERLVPAFPPEKSSVPFRPEYVERLKACQRMLLVEQPMQAKQLLEQWLDGSE